MNVGGRCGSFHQDLGALYWRLAVDWWWFGDVGGWSVMAKTRERSNYEDSKK